MIPKVRHIGSFQYFPDRGTKWVNYCEYDANGKNWADEWMRDESLFLALTFCNKCLKIFKKENGIEYGDWLEGIKNRKKMITKVSSVEVVTKQVFYDDVKKLREYLNV